MRNSAVVAGVTGVALFALALAGPDRAEARRLPMVDDAFSWRWQKDRPVHIDTEISTFAESPALKERSRSGKTTLTFGLTLLPRGLDREGNWEMSLRFRKLNYAIGDGTFNSLSGTFFTMVEKLKKRDLPLTVGVDGTVRKLDGVEAFLEGLSDGVNGTRSAAHGIIAPDLVRRMVSRTVFAIPPMAKGDSWVHTRGVRLFGDEIERSFRSRYEGRDGSLHRFTQDLEGREVVPLPVHDELIPPLWFQSKVASTGVFHWDANKGRLASLTSEFRVEGTLTTAQTGPVELVMTEKLTTRTSD